MLILIENLPDTISEDQIMQLISRYDSNAGIKLIDNILRELVSNILQLVTGTPLPFTLRKALRYRLDEPGSSVTGNYQRHPQPLLCHMTEADCAIAFDKVHGGHFAQIDLKSVVLR